MARMPARAVRNVAVVLEIIRLNLPVASAPLIGVIGKDMPQPQCHNIDKALAKAS
jgi:hypothetical protein